MELNFLKCDSIKTVQPIEIKFGTYDVGYFVMHCVDFEEYILNGMSTGTKGIILIHYRHWSKIFNVR